MQNQQHAIENGHENDDENDCRSASPSKMILFRFRPTMKPRFVIE